MHIFDQYILMPNTFIFIALEFLVTKRMYNYVPCPVERFIDPNDIISVYVGSFVAMLNARERKLGISSYSEDNYTQPSWKRPLRSHITSSFWSPRPGSLALELDVQLPVSFRFTGADMATNSRDQQSPSSATFKPDTIGQAL